MHCTDGRIILFLRIAKGEKKAGRQWVIKGLKSFLNILKWILFRELLLKRSEKF